MKKINGIIVNGRVYVATQGGKDYSYCEGCDFYTKDDCIYYDICSKLGRLNIFRYSQELTDKINKI